MTQAINLANFANNLDAAGGVSPNALNVPVPLAKGGTNAVSASTARTSLGLVIGTNVPSPAGTGASGSWPISITGNAAGSATLLQTANFTVAQVGTDLIFSYNSVAIASISSTGLVSSLAA